MHGWHVPNPFPPETVRTLEAIRKEANRERGHVRMRSPLGSCSRAEWPLSACNSQETRHSNYRLLTDGKTRQWPL